MIVYVMMTLMSTMFIGVAQYNYSLTLKRVNIVSNRHGIKMKKWKLFAILSVFPFAFVSGLRVNVGTDYTTYLRSDMYIGSVFAGNSIKMEPIYRIIVEIGRIMNSVQLVFFLTSVIFSGIIVLFIITFSKNWVLSVALVLLSGTFSQSLNIMRQMVATVIGLYAIKFIVEHDWKKYFLAIAVAAGFHSMAIIYFPLYLLSSDKIHLLSNKKNDKRKAGIILLLLAFYGVSGFLKRIIYNLLLNSGITYVKYFGSSRDTGSSRLLTITQIIIMAIMLFCSQNVNGGKAKKLYNIVICYSFLGCIVLAIGLPSANRIAYLFIPVIIVGLPNVIMSNTRKLTRIILSLCTIILETYFWYSYYYVSNISETFPYNSIFS
ncbi:MULTISPECIES: EpsG family protein [Butyrivibrio]|uniref:EpsG family protein n=1 Tax=Butyrivibrio TaxID=830 RepID=UPI0004056F52|nr:MULTISPECIES: EpsG family protein [Butyrivibrio]SEQ68019.1 EpsG family protein [Butyrivibrio sp. TB]